jgi:hypothetical protein
VEAPAKTTRESADDPRCAHMIQVRLKREKHQALSSPSMRPGAKVRAQSSPPPCAALIPASISATSGSVRCGRRAGTASMPARTVHSAFVHSASTAAASTSSPRNLAALIPARSACTAASLPRYGSFQRCRSGGWPGHRHAARRSDLARPIDPDQGPLPRIA